MHRDNRRRVDLGMSSIHRVLSGIATSSVPSCLVTRSVSLRLRHCLLGDSREVCCDILSTLIDVGIHDS
jgi:hypothetical protein